MSPEAGRLQLFSCGLDVHCLDGLSCFAIRSCFQVMLPIEIIRLRPGFLWSKSRDNREDMSNFIGKRIFWLYLYILRANFVSDSRYEIYEQKISARRLFPVYPEEPIHHVSFSVSDGRLLSRHLARLHAGLISHRQTGRTAQTARISPASTSEQTHPGRRCGLPGARRAGLAGNDKAGVTCWRQMSSGIQVKGSARLALVISCQQCRRAADILPSITRSTPLNPN